MTTIAIAQVEHSTSETPLEKVARYARMASAQGAELLIFPEYLMTPYELDVDSFSKASETANGPFVSAVREIAAAEGLWLLITMNETNPSDAKPFNTAVVINSKGEIACTYRKIHLFDVGDFAESLRCTPGSELCDGTVTPAGKLGLGICYDLRFEEVSQHAAACACNLLAYPAAWVDGPDKARQWRDLLVQRAQETGMWVLGAGRCGRGYTGCSCIVSPTGAVVEQAGSAEQLLVFAIR